MILLSLLSQYCHVPPEAVLALIYLGSTSMNLSGNVYVET